MDTLQFRNRLNERARQASGCQTKKSSSLRTKVPNWQMRLLVSHGRRRAAERSSDSQLDEEDHVHADRVRWATKAHKVLSKPANEINEQDASDVMSDEVGS